MMDATQKSLRWSKQMNLLPASATPSLRGDRIILPPSALEELLSAATVTVATTERPQTSTFDPFNPYSYAAETHARQQLFERQQHLPHPLTFRLVNPDSGKVVFAGIREFSAPENTVGLSPFLKTTLGFSQDEEAHTNGVENAGGDSAESQVVEPARLTVHVHELPKGTFIKLRPLEAGYDPDDWKALLEQYLRDTFTTMTNKEVINITAGRETFRFLVDGLKPNDEAISLVDTDIEVDIEPLNEEQARETLQKLAKKSQRAPGTKDGSSTGGKLQVDFTETGQVLPGEYVDYQVDDWDRSRDIEVEATSMIDGRDVDVFVSPYGQRLRSKPREDSFVFGELSSNRRKRLKVRHTNAELEGASAIWVSVRGYDAPEDDEAARSAPVSFSLLISAVDDNPLNQNNEADESNGVAGPDEEICSNCQQLVPKRTMFLHQNFCLRNNVFCPHCRDVFQKTSPEWKNHWHCEHDSAHGNDSISKLKHYKYLHTSAVCPSCDFNAANVPALAQHRTTTCPAKLILCQFCHLQVPQQGSEDPSPDSAEVLLSGLTPHEVSDGARTTECHLCDKIVRLRDMSVHLRHHDLERVSRTKPRICRNVNCGRTTDNVSRKGDIRPQATKNDLAICDTCFGPLYVSMYDPDGKALRRRVERKYLTQLLTGCGQAWCRNGYCKTDRKNSGVAHDGSAMTSKDAMQLIRPVLDRLTDVSTPLNFCTDEASQRRKTLAKMMAAEGANDTGQGKGKAKANGSALVNVSVESGYEIEWCVAALEVEGGDLDRARGWLKGFAPTRAETYAKS